MAYRMAGVGGWHVKPKSCFTAWMIFLCVPALVRSMPAQDTSAGGSNAGPPKFLNMIHQELKPGRIGAYDELETSIARIYNRENIPVFGWNWNRSTAPPKCSI